MNNIQIHEHRKVKRPLNIPGQFVIVDQIRYATNGWSVIHQHDLPVWGLWGDVEVQDET